MAHEPLPNLDAEIRLRIYQRFADSGVRSYAVSVRRRFTGCITALRIWFRRAKSRAMTFLFAP